MNIASIGPRRVLSYAAELVLDGRTFSRPANYLLARIIPPKGVEIDPTRRPFVVVDPRAGNLRADLLDGRAVVFAEIGDGFVTRNEPSRQPHHFQIAASLTLQPPARLNQAEIAADKKLEHRRGMISRPAGRCRDDAIETQLAPFQRIDEHVDPEQDCSIKAFR